MRIQSNYLARIYLKDHYAPYAHLYNGQISPGLQTGFRHPPFGLPPFSLESRGSSRPCPHVSRGRSSRPRIDFISGVTSGSVGCVAAMLTKAVAIALTVNSFHFDV
jgi:hypothetical protein